MKKRCILLLTIFIILNSFTFIYSQELNEDKEDELDLLAQGAILIDFDSKTVLYEKNPDEKLYPASTTKIMTAILAIEFGNLRDLVNIDQEVVDMTDGSHIALEAGEQLSLEDLLNALLIESANDSAVAIAKHISGSVENFVQLMNNKAKELGAKNTNFVNPSGLHDDNHYTSPRDLSLIARYAMENNIFRDIVKNYTAIIASTNKKNEPRYLKSANKLLYSNSQINVNGQNRPIKLEGVNGIKTGYTSKSKNCLVASIVKDGTSFLSVVLGSDPTNVFIDTHKLFDYGFKNFEKLLISNEARFIDNIEIQGGEQATVPAIIKSRVLIPINSKDKDRIVEKIEINDDLKAPIDFNQVIGKALYQLDGKTVKEVDIVSSLENPLKAEKSNFIYYLAFIPSIILGLLIFFRLRKLRRLSKLRAKRQRQRSNY